MNNLEAKSIIKKFCEEHGEEISNNEKLALDKAEKAFEHEHMRQLNRKKKEVRT